MKDFIKFSIEIIIIVALFFVADFSIGTILDKTCALRELPVGFKNIHNADYDMIIMGGSRAQSSYVVPTLEDRLGITIYDYGLGGTNLYVDYGLLDYYVKNAKKKPKIILWDIWATSFIKSPKYDIEPIQCLYSAYLQNDTIRSLINLQGARERFLLSGLHLYKHNSNLVDYFYSFLMAVTNKNNGYRPLNNKWNSSIEVEKNDRGDFDEQKIEYFKRFVNRCKKEGIYLVFCLSPSYYEIENTNADGKDWAQRACKYIQDSGFTALNYEQDSIFLSHPEWFYNPLHINENGADVFTQVVLPYLEDVVKTCYK